MGYLRQSGARQYSWRCGPGKQAQCECHRSTRLAVKLGTGWLACVEHRPSSSQFRNQLEELEARCARRWLRLAALGVERAARGACRWSGRNRFGLVRWHAAASVCALAARFRSSHGRSGSVAQPGVSPADCRGLDRHQTGPGGLAGFRRCASGLALLVGTCPVGAGCACACPVSPSGTLAGTLSGRCGSAQERAAMLEFDTCQTASVAAAKRAAATGQTLARGGLFRADRFATMESTTETCRRVFQRWGSRRGGRQEIRTMNLPRSKTAAEIRLNGPLPASINEALISKEHA